MSAITIDFAVRKKVRDYLRAAIARDQLEDAIILYSFDMDDWADAETRALLDRVERLLWRTATGELTERLLKDRLRDVVEPARAG